MPGGKVRNWDSLSPAYRARLTRSGISRSQYESGVSLSAARGHARTPEHPQDAYKQSGRQRYKDYRRERHGLVDQVVARKRELWGDRPRWNEDRARQYVSNGVKDTLGHFSKPALKDLRRFLELTDDEAERVVAGDREFIEGEFNFTWYH